jgi:signal transduction histidine kinase
MEGLVRFLISRVLRTENAVEAERSRIARDLHDGFAQELAFIAMQSRRLAHQTGEGTLEQIAEAAERALGQSRQVIAALAGQAEEPLHAAISATARRLATRAGARTSLDLDPRIEVPAETREHLLRILSEAVTNAVRHGGADRVEIKLSGEGGTRLRIADNGVGFDPSKRADRRTFGLVNMRERASASGADLRLRTWPGRGTEVEVVLP